MSSQNQRIANLTRDALRPQVVRGNITQIWGPKGTSLLYTARFRNPQQASQRTIAYDNHIAVLDIAISKYEQTALARFLREERAYFAERKQHAIRDAVALRDHVPVLIGPTPDFPACMYHSVQLAVEEARREWRDAVARRGGPRVSEILPVRAMLPRYGKGRPQWGERREQVEVMWGRNPQPAHRRRRTVPAVVAAPDADAPAEMAPGEKREGKNPARTNDHGYGLITMENFDAKYRQMEQDHANNPLLRTVQADVIRSVFPGRRNTVPMIGIEMDYHDLPSHWRRPLEADRRALAIGDLPPQFRRPLEVDRRALDSPSPGLVEDDETESEFEAETPLLADEDVDMDVEMDPEVAQLIARVESDEDAQPSERLLDPSELMPVDFDFAAWQESRGSP